MFVFSDTGAEHPATYKFIRQVNEHFDLGLRCIRAKFDPRLGVGPSYEEISIDEIGPRLETWRPMLKKHGWPFTPGGGFCTDRLKIVPTYKFLNDQFGLNSYVQWLGIRRDEPKRLKPKKNMRYMAEISNFEKQDVLDYWANMPFDLELEEHLGNCVFCIKKGVDKVALAAKDEPEMAREFAALLESEENRILDGNGGKKRGCAYRGEKTLSDIIATSAALDREYVREYMRRAARHEAGSCSESCEAIPDGDISEFDN